ncbi:MAG TPA: gas vesicle protein K [Thermoanaerobaculia bacterium]|nr:gas vesicle protein K [Thermoanaerobaculia bacterium]
MKHDDESIVIVNREGELREALEFTDSAIPERISADPEAIENGLARLVLSIIELIRKLLEKQALRRMDGGNLSDEELERLGTALMRLEEKMAELKATFGLEDDDLNLELGPIRTLE